MEEFPKVIISDEVEQNQPYEIKSSVSAWVVTHKGNGENYLLVEFEGQTYLARVFTAATVEEQTEEIKEEIKEEVNLTGNYLTDKLVLSYLDINQLMILRTTSKYAANLVDEYLKHDINDKRYSYYRNAKQFKPAELPDWKWLNLLEKIKVYREIQSAQLPDVIYTDPELAAKDLKVRPVKPNPFQDDILPNETFKQLTLFKYPIHLYKMIEDVHPGYLFFHAGEELFDMILDNINQIVDVKGLYSDNPHRFDKINEILNYLLSLGILPRQSYPRGYGVIRSNLDVLAYFGDIEMLNTLANLNPPILVGEVAYNMGHPSQEYNNWVRTISREKINAWLASLPQVIRHKDPRTKIGNFNLPTY